MIYGIHPVDKDLQFLAKTNADLNEKYKDKFCYFKLEADHISHEACINVLKKESSGLLLFFCHGLEKSIRGCNFVYDSSSLQHKDFTYGALISPTKNIEIFKGKNIFCLACNSRDLGKYSIDIGAKVFLGFGDIFFFVKENFKEEKISASTKNELRTIIYNCLNNAIESNITFNELSLNLIQGLNSKIYQLLSEDSKARVYNIEVSKALSKIKNGITIFGNGNIRVLDF